MALVLASRVASAAEPVQEGIRIDQMQPASAESAFFYAEGPHQAFSEGVEFAAGVTFEYGKGLLNEVSYDRQGKRTVLVPLVEHAVFARLSGSITPLHWLSFDLSLPFALFERGAPAVSPGSAWHSAAPFGVGDLRVGVHFRPIDTRAFGLLLGGRFWAPLGSEEAYLSDGRLRAEIDVGVAGEAKRLLYGCSFSVAPGLVLRRNGDRAAAACALHGAVSSVVSIGVEPAASLISTKVNDKPSFGVLVEPLAALRLRLGGFRIGVAAGPGFGFAAGAAQVRALLNFAYVGRGKPPAAPTSSSSDRDLDKIPDNLDACPDEAGATSDNPKQRGCPVRDRDADGISDEQDFCPDRVGVRHPNPKASGCPDADNDGLPDPIDSCRIEPGSVPDGCPRYARLTGVGFEVRPQITFSKKDDKISREGRAAIEEIAASMRANPSIARISIEIGTRGDKPKVSDKHAEQILLVLRAGNLDTSRYEVVLRSDLPARTVVVRLLQ